MDDGETEHRKPVLPLALEGVFKVLDGSGEVMRPEQAERLGYPYRSIEHLDPICFVNALCACLNVVIFLVSFWTEARQSEIVPSQAVVNLHNFLLIFRTEYRPIHLFELLLRRLHNPLESFKI